MAAAASEMTSPNFLIGCTPVGKTTKTGGSSPQFFDVRARYVPAPGPCKETKTTDLDECGDCRNPRRLRALVNFLVGRTCALGHVRDARRGWGAQRPGDWGPGP